MKIKIEGRNKPRGMCFAGGRSTSFDAATVDHNALARMIGNAAVQVINQARDQRVDLQRMLIELTLID